tara:strand:+ start:275 stop:511 length:237 start_codon:yes stop_codon:yes gene_type:complete
MEEKILEILKDNEEWEVSLENTAKELLNLFSVSGSAETKEQKNCEHEYYDTYFCNADGDSFELDDVKCIKCGKIDLEI